MKLKYKKQSGFTMIEIMVVVVIVAILAVIALPTYLDYVKSSYASEARTVMSNINNASKMYYQTRGDWPSEIDELERAGQLDVSRSTKLKWTFDLQLSDQGGRITATSTEEMSGGAGHQVVYDADLGKFTGYGSPEGRIGLDLNKLLTYSVDSGASDLHLKSVGSIPMVRINGTMKPLNMEPLKQEDMESILPQVLDQEQINIFEQNKEIDFSASLEGKGRFRVNFFNQIKGLAGVFRTIPEVVKDFDDLGIPPVLKNLALMDRGLVLLTGPTGSGKVQH